MTKNILKTRFPSKFVGPQGQTSPLWPPPGRPNARGEGDRQEEKQDLAHRACASRAGEARARGNPGGEHCCLNIKQGFLVSHMGDFLMLPGVLRWVPLG